MNKKLWKITEALTGVVSVKKAFLEISQNSHENTCVRVSFFNKVAGLRPKNEVSNFLNRILTSHKKELVVQNCQWNCMLYSN